VPQIPRQSQSEECTLSTEWKAIHLAGKKRFTVERRLLIQNGAANFFTTIEIGMDANQ